jgi:hypothetical protein
MIGLQRITLFCGRKVLFLVLNDYNSNAGAWILNTSLVCRIPLYILLIQPFVVVLTRKFASHSLFLHLCN